jgi:hypothetical protein
VQTGRTPTLASAAGWRIIAISRSQPAVSHLIPETLLA